MPTYLCKACGTQYPPGDEPPGACPICEDPRQYIPHDTGQTWLTLEELRDRAGEPDVVVVDPPRAGLAGKALKRVGETAAPRLVYVSCNPTTLAGDAKRLREEYGYELVRARPVDMFPHTPHVETVALLER